MSEKRTQNAIMRLSRGDVRLWRNNQGQAYMGKATNMQGRNVLIRDAQPVRFGIGNPGGSDTIGFVSVVITPEMVGHRVAIFTAVEVKHGRGKPTVEQQAFVDTVNRHGGRAGVAYSVEDAEGIIHGKNGGK